MQDSVWTQNISLPHFPKLTKNVKTDVLIIGGGMCGILCAYYLQKANIDYMLVEGNRIASGVTCDTTAKITSLHGLIYNKLIHSIGTEKARLYLEANETAIDKYRSLTQNIECDWTDTSAFTYSCSSPKNIEKEVHAVELLGYPAKFYETIPIPVDSKGAICFENQAQFNPLKFINEIVKDLNIYENTYITQMAPNTAWAGDYKISTNKIIVATHFPFLNKHGSYFMKLYQHRSYVIALKSALSADSLLNSMYIDESLKGLSFRSYNFKRENLLLLGGGSHRTGKKGGNWKELRNFAAKQYPGSSELFAWATQDCMTLDDIPYIGQYSANTPDLYVATGFNKWGMTGSMVSAMILCDLIQDKENEYSHVFSPQRSILKPQLFINGSEAVLNLLTPSKKRCPHLGCVLKWNPSEHSWDCPCHGSRFTANGDLIDNPATGNAHIK